jgi:hypothetical protein
MDMLGAINVPKPIRALLHVRGRRRLISLMMIIQVGYNKKVAVKSIGAIRYI